MNAWSQRLQRIWYGNEQPPWLLHLLARIYALWLKQRPTARPRPQALPLLVVGNLVAGGSGKTPLVLHLTQFLQRQGLRVAVMARVYQGSERSVHVLDANSNAGQVGDEPLLLHQHLQCPVVVSRKRRYAYDYIVNNIQDIDLVISDDGLQHRHFKADISIGVVAAKRGFGNGRLLPAGPLREPLKRLLDLDYLVIKSDVPEQTATAADLPGLSASVAENAVSMSLAVIHAIRLRDNKQLPLQAFAQQQVSALAAIADPESFFALLRAPGLQIHAYGLPDHCHVPDAVWQQLPPDRPLLLTSKDAVKISEERINAGSPEIWVVPLQTELPADFLDDLLQHCRRLTCRAA